MVQNGASGDQQLRNIDEVPFRGPVQRRFPILNQQAVTQTVIKIQLFRVRCVTDRCRVRLRRLGRLRCPESARRPRGPGAV